MAAGEGRDDKEAKVRSGSSWLLLLAILKSRSANVPLVRATLMLSVDLTVGPKTRWRRGNQPTGLVWRDGGGGKGTPHRQGGVSIILVGRSGLSQSHD